MEEKEKEMHHARHFVSGLKKEFEDKEKNRSTK
jgi:hypothetical protein